MTTRLINPKTGKELIDPKTEFAFKKLFASDFEKGKRRLLSLINAFAGQEDQMITVIQEINLINPSNNSDFSDDEESILDIRAMDENGSFTNIEIHAASDPKYFKRALFHWATVYSSRVNEPELTHLRRRGSYSNFNRTIGIHFVDCNCIDHPKAEYHNIFEVANKKNPNIVVSGMYYMEIHLIELRKISEMDNYDTAFEWAKFFADASSCIRDGVKSEAIKDTLDELCQLNPIGKEREEYEASLKRFYDQNKENND